MPHKYGYDLREHVLYPRKYMVIQNGIIVLDEYHRPMHRLSLQRAQKRIQQLIKIQDKQEQEKLLREGF